MSVSQTRPRARDLSRLLRNYFSLIADETTHGKKAERTEVTTAHAQTNRKATRLLAAVAKWTLF